MKARPTTLNIAKAEYTGKYTLKLWFSDGKVQTIDFGPFLQCSLHPEIRKFLSFKNFRKFTVKDGDLMWGDFDLLFPILDLYENKLDRTKAATRKRVG